MVKSTTREKMGNPAKSVAGLLCEPKMNIHNPHPLWITPVEKSVENVENSELSTGISFLWKFTPACGKGCIYRCILLPEVAQTVCYVTAEKNICSVKTKRKSLQIVKIRCQILSHLSGGQKFFVKNRQNTFGVSSPGAGEYFSYPVSMHWGTIRLSFPTLYGNQHSQTTGGHHAGKS